MTKNQWIKIIEGIIIIIIGILMACTIINPSIFDILLGIIFMAGGFGLLIQSIIKTNSLITVLGLIGTSAIGVGILFVCNQLSQLIGILESLLLVSLMAVGALLILDSIIKFFTTKKLAPNIIEIIIGVAFLTIGLVFWFVNDAKSYTFVVAGIIIALIGLLVVIGTFVNLNKYFKLSKKE